MADAALSGSLQENVLILACFHDRHAKVVRGLVPVELFEGYYREIAKRAYAYLDRFGKPVGDHITDEFDDIIDGQDRRKGEAFAALLVRLYDSRDVVNVEYVMARATAFVDQQRLKQAIIEAATNLETGEEDTRAQRAIEVLQRFRTTGALFSPGVFLNDDKAALDWADDPLGEAFPTGIDLFDRLGLGPRRKELHYFWAPPNSGKSWWLIHLGKMAWMRRHRVLHLSLEMSEQQVVKRYFQALFAIPKRHERLVVQDIIFDQGKFLSLRPNTLELEHSLSDDNIREHLRNVQHKAGARLRNILVRQFPTGKLNLSALEGYLDMLADRDNFMPDLLVVDYADLMSLERRAERRHAINDVLVDLRGLAVERNFALATASQLSKEGMNAQTAGLGHAEEAFNKSMVPDTVITYSQSTAEAQHGLARLHVAKARDEARGQRVIITQSYASGQFVLQSAPMEKHYMAEVDNLG